MTGPDCLRITLSQDGGVHGPVGQAEVFSDNVRGCCWHGGVVVSGVGPAHGGVVVSGVGPAHGGGGQACWRGISLLEAEGKIYDACARL